MGHKLIPATDHLCDANSILSGLEMSDSVGIVDIFENPRNPPNPPGGGGGLNHQVVVYHGSRKFEQVNILCGQENLPPPLRFGW